jgi:hypothetical protein
VRSAGGDLEAAERKSEVAYRFRMPSPSPDHLPGAKHAQACWVHYANVEVGSRRRPRLGGELRWGIERPVVAVPGKEGEE